MDNMENEELYKAVFNKVNDIITLIEIKEDGSAANFIEVNDVAVKKLGYSREEFIHMTPKDIGSTPIKNKEKIKQLLSTGRVSFERNYITKDGKIIPVEINSHIINFKDKNVALSVARDVHDRIEAEINIKESEERLKDLFDNATDLIQMVNHDGSFLYVNKSWKDALGYSDQDLKKMKVFDVIFPDHLEQCKLAFERVKQGETINKIESGFKTKDGEEVIVEGNINGKLNPDGKFMYSRAIFRDITETKEAESEIQRLASIVESSGDAIIGYDLDGIVLNWNHAAEELYGYPVDEIKGENLSKVMNPEKWEENLKNIEKIKNGELVSHFETSRIKKDGTEFQVSISLSPIKDVDGKIVGISGISRDITESKKAQEALQASEEKYRKIVEKFIQNALALIAEINNV